MSIKVCPVAPLLVVLCVAFLSAGCSGFNRAWKKAAAAPVPGAGIEGRWEGMWLSDYNQHKGRLRCLVTHQTNQVYEAWFHAKFQKIFTFTYKVDLEVTRTGDVYRFEGREDLGKLGGGVYEYEGKVEGTNFVATYKAKYDYGTFRMSRPVDP